MVRPVTVHGDDEHVPVIPPGEDVAVYAVIVAPPFEDGAVKATVACVLPAVAVPIVGAPGGDAAAVIEIEAMPAPGCARAYSE